MFALLFFIADVTLSGTDSKFLSTYMMRKFLQPKKPAKKVKKKKFKNAKCKNSLCILYLKKII
jgi:hypothetical protein